MDVRIASSVVEDVRAASRAAHPAEACGLLYGAAKTLLFCDVAPNVAQLPQRQFEIDPAHLFAAHKAARQGGRAIVGCWHSHPSAPAYPSPEDARRAADLGWIWLIIGQDGDVAAFEVVEDGPIAGRFAPVRLALID